MSKEFDDKTDQKNMQIIFTALEFAAVKHQFQKRKGADGIPYINHLIEVSSLLIQKLDEASVELLVAAILHDVIEDTDAEAEEIKKKFCEKVMHIVMEVSDDMNLPSLKRKSLQIENAKDLSYEASCIKIADKTCNIRDILFTRIKWSRKRKIKYIQWAKKVVDQIRSTHTGLIDEFNRTVKQSKDLLEMS